MVTLINKPTISVVLNVYRRSSNFGKQLAAINNQSIKPIEILVWENGTESVPDEFRDQVTIARSSRNLGVWARFAFALNAKGDYVCILDDDTIPGKRWLENCYRTMLATPGLLGTRGLIFENPSAYSMHRDIGVYGPNETTQPVDIVGHSWFFKASWLSCFWSEYENRFAEDLAGEDIHFSYAIQKNMGLPTLVPPHPKEDLSLWGSNPDLAFKLGTGEESISRSGKSLKRFESALQHYRTLGFKAIAEIDGTSSRYPGIVYRLVRIFPQFSHDIARKIRTIRKSK